MTRQLRRCLVLLGILAMCMPGPLRATDVDGPVDCGRNNQDFGDAPEGTAVLAYPGVAGRFPTCITPGPVGTRTTACPAISTLPGPTGYVQHITPAAIPAYWLGCGAAAPMGIDTEGDGKVNNSAVLGAPSACSGIATDCVEAAFGLSFGQDECYGSTDAGVLKPNLRTCKPANVTFKTTNCAAVAKPVYLNILVDMNHDGDWNDNFLCSGNCAYEWAVKNQLISLPVGCATLTSAGFMVGPTPGPGWMRVSLSDSVVTNDFPWAGSAISGPIHGGETEDYPVTIAKPATISLNPLDIGWQTVTPSTVRFHLTFRNEDTEDPSEAASGEINSQAFGVFQPNHGPIGTFNIPPIAPGSFFDVFLDAPLSALPPTAFESKPWQGTIAAARAGHASVAGVDTCPPDDHWDGNVDVTWSSASATGQVNKHIGTLEVCPAHGNSYIHALVFCADPAGASWAITGVCPGWTATLVNEGPPLVPAGPAPNPVPPGWTGFICLSADGSVLPGATCPMQVTFTCNGVDGVIDLEPVACNCGQQFCDITYRDFGDAPEGIAAYSGGVSGHFPTCTFSFGPGTQTVACGPPLSTPPGPTGYVMHISPSTLAQKVWLGCGLPGSPGLGVDTEGNAKVNIDPPYGLMSACDSTVAVDCFEPAWLNFGQDECYGSPDAAIASPMTFHTCRDTVVELTAYGCGVDSVDAHLNVLVDWNGDGDWNDVERCSQPVACRPEWVLKNGRVRIGPGCNLLRVPVRAGPRAGEGWMRVTLTIGEVADDFPWNGSLGEPNLAYVGGETEDYPVRIAQSVTDAGPATPGKLGFAPLTPNPSRDGTMARFTLARDGDASLVVYDITGRAVRVLLQRYMPAGEHQMLWDFRDNSGRAVPAGLYLVKLRVGQDVFTRRVIHLN